MSKSRIIPQSNGENEDHFSFDKKLVRRKARPEEQNNKILAEQDTFEDQPFRTSKNDQQHPLVPAELQRQREYERLRVEEEEEETMTHQQRLELELEQELGITQKKGDEEEEAGKEEDIMQGLEYQHQLEQRKAAGQQQWQHLLEMADQTRRIQHQKYIKQKADEKELEWNHLLELDEQKRRKKQNKHKQIEQKEDQSELQPSHDQKQSDKQQQILEERLYELEERLSEHQKQEEKDQVALQNEENETSDKQKSEKNELSDQHQNREAKQPKLQQNEKKEDPPSTRKAKSNKKRSRSRPRTKRKPIFNLYDTKDSHPIIEYEPSKEESESASLTPSFVLEVTWPRLIQFYHPSSPRCLTLQSIYVALARGIKRRSSRLPVEFHAVNCGLYRDVCEQAFNVRSVPTIIGLKSGRIEGIELALPGSFNSTSLPKKEFVKDIEDKVEYTATALNVPLDALKKGHAGATFAQDADSALDEQKIIADYDAQHRTSDESAIPVSEQVFYDARSSLLTTLTSSLYSQLPHGSALPPDTSKALAEFLDLIRWAFPPETRVHDLAEDLRHEYFRVSTSEDGLLEVVRKHMNLGGGITWSSRCGSEEATGGYSCGLWSLLHILSIGVAERHASVVGDSDRITVNHAGDVMRTFISQFFVGCDSCREGWIELYDETSESTNPHSDAYRGGQAEEWKNLSVWIWKVHNEITIRLHQPDGKSYYKQSRMTSASSLWPSREDCPSCWQSLTDDTGQAINMDSYEKKELYDHLKKTYWPSGVHNNRLIVLDRWSKAKRALSMRRLRARMAAHHWSLSVTILHLLVACLIFRVAFPRLSKMIYYCFVGKRHHHPKRHKTRAHLSRGHRKKNENESYPTYISQNNHSVQSDRNGIRRRGEGSNHHNSNGSYGNRNERHGGRRKQVVSNSRTKSHNFNFNHVLQV